MVLKRDCGITIFLKQVEVMKTTENVSFFVCFFVFRYRVQLNKNRLERVRAYVREGKIAGISKK